MKRMSDINDYLTTSLGIFKQIYTTFSSTFTWLDESVADNLDLEYYLNHSANKFISPLVDRLYDDNSSTYLSKTANVIVNKFADKWNKLYDALIDAEYNPIENYSMVEDEKVQTEVVNDTKGDDNTFGFNTTSTDGVPQNKTSATTTTTGDFDKNHRQLTRSGNIGVTTSQQMIESSAVLLNKWNFYDILMSDVDSVMCLAFRRV